MQNPNYIEGTAESIPVDDNEFEFIVSALLSRTLHRHNKSFKRVYKGL